MNAKHHYDKHLGNFYSWMVGNFEEKQMEQELFFRHYKILPRVDGSALDLGSGHGLQSVSLAKLGFSVKAIDFNLQLLRELREKSSGLSIETIESDILSFLERSTKQVELIVCMGDTLTHFESMAQVEILIERVAKFLIPKGKIIISFRDLTLALTDVQRFIPVRSNENRILTCFLEYHPSYVLVHDILQEKENGVWKQKVSAYPKLRMNEKIVTDIFHRNNISPVYSQVINRMIYLIGEKN